jgi:hypothetical protein
MPASEVPRRRALLIAGAVLGGAVLGAGAMFAANALGAEQTTPVASAGATAPDAPAGTFSSAAVCRSLVPAADQAFGHAAAMARSLADYDKVVGSAGAGASGGARGPGSAALARGAGESALFNAAYAGYVNEVTMSCGPTAAAGATVPASPTAAACRENPREFVRSVRTWVDQDGDELGSVQDAALVQLGRVARLHPSVLEASKLYPFQRDRFVVAANKSLCPGQP